MYETTDTTNTNSNPKKGLHIPYVTCIKTGSHCAQHKTLIQLKINVSALVRFEHYILLNAINK